MQDRQLSHINYYIKSSEARLKVVKLGQRLAYAVKQQESKYNRHFTDKSLDYAKAFDKERPKSLQRLHKIRPDIRKSLIDETYSIAKYDLLNKELHRLKNLTPIFMVIY